MVGWKVLEKPPRQNVHWFENALFPHIFSKFDNFVNFQSTLRRCTSSVSAESTYQIWKRSNKVFEKQPVQNAHWVENALSSNQFSKFNNFYKLQLFFQSKLRRCTSSISVESLYKIWKWSHKQSLINRLDKMYIDTKMH